MLARLSLALARARAIPTARNAPTVRGCASRFCALMAGLGLAAGFGAGCQDNSEDSPPTSSVTATATVVYEMSVGESTLIEHVFTTRTVGIASLVAIRRPFRQSIRQPL